MSLANLIVQPTRAVLQADAGAYLADGTAAFFRPKLFRFEAAGAAMSMRGDVDLEALLAELHAARAWAADLPTLLQLAPGALARAAGITIASTDARGIACLHLIAWDRRRAKPFGALLASDPAWFGGAAPAGRWIVVDNARGHGDVALSDLIGRPLTDADLSDPTRFDIERDSLPLIEAMRARPWGGWPVPDTRCAVAVRIGGWVDQAEVTARGVTEQRIVTWPDRPGERIGGVVL